MRSLGKDVGSEVLVRAAMSAALAGATTNNGAAFDLASLPTKANSVRAVVGFRANLDAADNVTVDNIKLQSSPVANFASGVVDRATVSDVVRTGATGETDVDYYDVANLDYDLTKLPETHRYIRISARTTMSDTANTSGQVFGVLVFGGLAVTQ